MTPQTAPDIIHKLVETFEQNLDSYRSSKNETELRVNFLNPFFTALGWDVSNEKGYDEAHKEVTHEFSVEVAGQGKKADYAFRTGADKFDFLVEAKKPSVKVESSQEAAFQLRRYGWSAKIPINILTDFEHFAVYDCRMKPNYSDKASMGRIMLVHYKDFVSRWNEIAEIFSPEAVRKGSLAKYAEGMKGKKGTADVDDAFLQEIERWREALAKNIALRNDDIDVPGLNYAVQMTIDRIVFLRICEERGIEPENQLLDIATPLAPPIFAERGKTSKTPNGENGGMSAGQGGGVYAELCELFKRADTKYNSGLFHFPAGRFAKQEKEQNSRPDDLTLSLAIDDKVLKDIISNLYYPKSPYAFLYIPSDILGQVYERFLGKVIRLTAGHSAKVEEKPEVRKAGGVYYTPTYIVDYIVKNTVGKLLDPTPSPSPNSKSEFGEGGKRVVTPAEVAKIKIVDPACGSGTFLLGAYQFLLDWHLEWYTNNDPEKWVKAKAITPISTPPDLRSPSPNSQNLGRDGEGLGGRVGGDYRLTTAKKKEILLNNIHGVDIDAQAVEVTKLSLLLKVLENSSGQLGLGMERVLPDLGNNIKCGNSLIGFDYFEGQLFPDEEERARVNPFDWEREFPQVFHRLVDGHLGDDRQLGRGGFDAVIGNPPYIRIQDMQEWASNQVEFFKQKYKAASKGNYDIYVVFIEKALSLLNEKGKLGFILPHKFFNAQYGEPVRDLVSQGKHISKIVHFADQQVFDGATTYTCLLFLNRQIQNEFEFTKVSDLEGWRNKTSEVSETSEVSGTINAANINAAEWNFTVGKDAGLFEKLSQMPVKLGDVAKRIFQGFKTGADPVFILDKLPNGKFYSNALKSEINIETTYLRPLYKSGEMKRYGLRQNSRFVIFPYHNGALIDWKEISMKAPNMAEYLKSCKDILAKREKGRWVGSQWYCYSRNQALEIVSSPKILTADLNPSANYCFDQIGEACFPGGAAGGYGIVLDANMYLYVLGLLNSKAVDYYHKKISTNFRGGWFGYDAKVIRNIPIRPINFSDPAEKAAHDKMVSLVEQMLALHKSLASAQSPQEKERLERQIQNTDASIDSLVYALYGLNEEEIKVVEGK
ncbi:MAG: Eco57I restriction-modification methylase domain-containing protein [Chloroflexi bacterium]|nr:Eco57I restriction-modification methylase domain-containing protein [Chloroflexota bacterium]